MVTLCVEGGGWWRKEDGWLWIRIRIREKSEGCKDRLIIERRLLRGCDDAQKEWNKQFRIQLSSDQWKGGIDFELWTGESRGTDLLQFVTGWSVDLAKWIHSGAATRWYTFRTMRAQERNRANSDIDKCGYCESVTELQSSQTFVRVGVEDLVVESPEIRQPNVTMAENERPIASDSKFQFVLPRCPPARSSKLCSVRVGQIVHELRTDILHDMLPLTLFGQASFVNCNVSNRSKPKEPDNGMAKALGLLQLSCQYASHCISELDSHASKLERQRAVYRGNISRLKRHQVLLKERESNLKRELEVLSCSLDSMESLLREVDPETLNRLQTMSNQNCEEVVDEKH